MKLTREKAHPRPGLPTVNLLSQSQFDRLAVRRLRKRFAAGAVALVLVAGAGWFVQHTRVADQQKLVAVEQAQTSRLSAETRTLTTIRTFVTGVAAQQQTISTTMAHEIYFSKVLEGIRQASPSGTDLQSIAVTLAADPAAGATGGSVCPGPDPFKTETLVGCVTLSGTAVSRAEVGDLVTTLGGMDLFVEPFISTTTTGDQTSVSFSGSVGLSEKVYSNRYAPAAAKPADGTGSTDGADSSAGTSDSTNTTAAADAGGES